MATWHLDEGLARFEREWKAAHPGAVIYKIGDSSHSQDPDVSQHAPDDGGSQPGDDKGEVDAVDVMPGKGGVTDKDLDDLAENLRKSRDPRILIVIRRNQIFSSVVQPWVWRPYKGKYHGHTHISVNDKFDNNQADWKWENPVARTVSFIDMAGQLPVLKVGDDDEILPGWNHVGRLQALLIFQGVNIDIDGVYGAQTAGGLKALMSDKSQRSSNNGTMVGEPEWRTLIGLSA